MKMQRGLSQRRLIVGVAGGLSTMAFVPNDANAALLQMTVSEGATSYVILDNGPLDSTAGVNSIQALASVLVFPDYTVVGLNASTNDPGTPSIATLIVGGEVQKLTQGEAQPLIVTVTDTDFTLPSPGRLLNSSMSTTYTGAPSAVRFFTSWYNPTNAPYAKDISQGAPVPLVYGSTGIAPNSEGDTAAVVGVPFAPLYGLTNETVIVLNDAGSDVVFGGSTAITAPEPATFSLLALGLPLSFWARRRR